MKPKTDLKVWISLALDRCPDCGKVGLVVENQQEASAVLACPECGSSYWISPIRERGARKLSRKD
jgi:uncharacterized protein with PIN domain